MKKGKAYNNVAFPGQTIKDAHNLFLSKLNAQEDKMIPTILSITYEGEEVWEFDNIEEFFCEYRKARDFLFAHRIDRSAFYVRSAVKNRTVVEIEGLNRPDIESIFQIFERDVENSTVEPETPPVKIFIGHGHDNQWKDLKDHLHEMHGYEVIAYEVGPRAGLTIREVLETMLNESSFAFLVLTAEDIHQSGEAHARDNVVHEVGLFQGRLGFRRAIVLLEEGVKEFSNIHGLNQIRFSKGKIRETFGDVLATIKREVG